jgi:excisionase family DNA binding protein
MSGLITDNLITPNELTEFLRISKSSLYRLVDGRIIPFCKVGGVLRFRKSDIEDYIEKSLIRPLER